MNRSLVVEKVLTSESRAAALAIVDRVYREEKRWLGDSRAEIVDAPELEARVSWFVAREGEEPLGAIRLVYDPPLRLPEEYGLELEPGVDLEDLARRGRFVDIGRFMIVPERRRDARIALELMRAASAEVVERGYSHFLTDVFESDPHSPLGFHTRVLGFERIGRHARGELASTSARILLILDIGRAYRRLQEKGNRIFRRLAAGLDERLLVKAPAQV